MRIARAGLPFILPLVVAALVATALTAWVAAAALALAAGYVSFFFRDPERRAPTGADLVLAPGDGRLVAVGSDGDGNPTLSIFLGLLDVHVNRAPSDGTVMAVDYRPGRFVAAFKSEAGDVNEQNRVEFATAGGTLRMHQIVGIAARRIEFWKSRGDVVRAGERVGIMKFGSRIDLRLPPGSEVLLAPGARVRAGETVLARMRVASSSQAEKS